MTNDIRFDRIPLKDFARRIKRLVNIEPTNTYRTIGCHLYGRGVYQREAKKGSEIKAKRMFLVRQNDFVINRIWAQKGSAGIVPSEISGSVVTSDFPIYELDLDSILPSYIAWYVRTEDFWEECKRHSRGTSGRERISPKELPSVTFPICELNQQKVIVDKIERIISRLDETRKLRHNNFRDIGTLMQSVLHRIFHSNMVKRKWKTKELEEICQINPSKSEIKDLPHDLQVTFVPMKALDEKTGRITKPEVRLLGEVKKGYTYFKEGDVLFAKITPCMENGKSAVAYDLINKIGFGSTEFHVIRPKEKVIPEWIHYFLRQESLRKTAARSMKGTAGQQRVPKSFLSSYEFPLPPIEEQKTSVAYLDNIWKKVLKLKEIDDEIRKDIKTATTMVLNKAFKGEL